MTRGRLWLASCLFALAWRLTQCAAWCGRHASELLGPPDPVESVAAPVSVPVAIPVEAPIADGRGLTPTDFAQCLPRI